MCHARNEKWQKKAEVIVLPNQKRKRPLRNRNGKGNNYRDISSDKQVKSHTRRHGNKRGNPKRKNKSLQIAEQINAI